MENNHKNFKVIGSFLSFSVILFMGIKYFAWNSAGTVYLDIGNDICFELSRHCEISEKKKSRISFNCHDNKIRSLEVLKKMKLNRKDYKVSNLSNGEMIFYSLNTKNDEREKIRVFQDFYIKVNTFISDEKDHLKEFGNMSSCKRLGGESVLNKIKKVLLVDGEFI